MLQHLFGVQKVTAGGRSPAAALSDFRVLLRLEFVCGEKFPERGNLSCFIVELMTNTHIDKCKKYLRMRFWLIFTHLLLPQTHL